MPTPALAGQTVVLIGGSAGIGLETGRRARTEGADVILTGRSQDRLDAARNAPPRSTPPTRPPWRGSSRTCRHRSTTCW